jgi:hypothetical protein
VIENDYFASNERVELAHIMILMFGYTEYKLLSTSGMEVVGIMTVWKTSIVRI